MTDSRDREGLTDWDTERILDELARRISNSPDPARYLDEIIHILREKIRQNLEEKNKKIKKLRM